MPLRDLVLVLLSTPGSGWDLARRMAELLPRLSRTPASQIYPVLHRLEAAGLADSQDEPSRQGPPRRVHALTDAGRERVAAILGRPPRERGSRRPDLVHLALLDRLSDDRRADAVLSALLATAEADLAAARHDLAALGEHPHGGQLDGQRHRRLMLRLEQAELEARVALLGQALSERGDHREPR